MSLLLYLFVLVAAISLCIVAFLIISVGDLTKFKTIYGPKSRPSILPMISRYGDLISTPLELEGHITGLKARLREKYQELETYKTKIHNSKDNLQKLNNYKRGCIEMQANLIKTEEDCKDLQEKIEYYKRVQMRIQEDLAPGYTYMGDADWMVMGNTNVSF